MTIGKRIKELRIKHGLTQEKLALALNVTPQSISKWENDITMPDIALLPNISTLLGVTIDELFDLSVDQQLERIEHRLDVEEVINPADFVEMEKYLKEKLNDKEYQYKATYLISYLYTRRLMSDTKMIEKYAKQGIRLEPQKKDLEWMLGKTDNYNCWDWDMSNHTNAINFYKEVYQDNPNSSLCLCYLIDNLLADRRSDEAQKYLEKYQQLKPDNIALIAAYQSGIALARYDEAKADSIMEDLIKNNPNNDGCLFEVAQYYAKKAQYDKAINYFEESFEKDPKRPRFIDALLSIADIYDIMGDIKKEIETYDRIIACSRDEWGMDEEIELKDTINKRNSLLNKIK